MASENNATIHDTKIYKVSESIQQHMEELEPILQTAIKVGATFDISGSALLQNTILVVHTGIEHTGITDRTDWYGIPYRKKQI